MHESTIAVAAAALLLAGGLSAQERTERFIPIGQSPGVSGVSSTMGTISAVNAGERTVTVRNGTETVRVRIPEETDIWIDRSASRRTNVVGDWNDLSLGRSVEVKWVDVDGRQEADWVKVEGGPMRSQ